MQRLKSQSSRPSLVQVAAAVLAAACAVSAVAYLLHPNYEPSQAQIPAYLKVSAPLHRLILGTDIVALVSAASLVIYFAQLKRLAVGIAPVLLLLGMSAEDGVHAVLEGFVLPVIALRFSSVHLMDAAVAVYQSPVNGMLQTAGPPLLIAGLLSMIIVRRGSVLLRMCQFAAGATLLAFLAMLGIRTPFDMFNIFIVLMYSSIAIVACCAFRSAGGSRL